MRDRGRCPRRHKRGARTEDGGGQSRLDDGKGGVISFMGNVDMMASQQVLAQDALKTFQNPDPLPLLRLALGQHQQGHGGQRRDELRGRDLEEQQQSDRSRRSRRSRRRDQAGPATLKMQGTSFLVAWMTSEASTELTEKASSLEHRRTQADAGTPPALHLRLSLTSDPAPDWPPHLAGWTCLQEHRRGTAYSRRPRPAPAASPSSRRWASGSGTRRTG